MVLGYRKIAPPASVHVGIRANPKVGSVHVWMTAVRIHSVIRQERLQYLRAINVSWLHVYNAGDCAIVIVCQLKLSHDPVRMRA